MHFLEEDLVYFDWHEQLKEPKCGWYLSFNSILYPLKFHNYYLISLPNIMSIF